MLAGWAPLCESHSCSLPQIVLAWTLAQEGVNHVLAGSRRPEQIIDNAAAAELDLGAETLAQMEQDLAGIAG